RVFGGAYQGSGVGGYSFGNRRELGTPVALYLYQGARIAVLSPRLSLNYEWNFGLSFGWKPYDREENPADIMIGSRMNAYINTGFYLDYLLSPRVNLLAGVTLTHFSNGNTRFPNAGLNMIDCKAGVAYHINRTEASLPSLAERRAVPAFPRHMSYDLVAFGSWRRKGYFEEDRFVPSPSAYKVLGASFAAMYNVSYKFRVGAAVDWVYDASANVFVLRDLSRESGFVEPPFDAQTAWGLSGRVEYVMPYFIVGIGMGTNVLHRGGDLKSFYQMLLLKIAVTRNLFLHVGYNLKDFRDPNFLMLGVGFRFNNKYPVLDRRLAR
ncbi:MAG: acyloxyacyl hydrolase, partial [Odoribacter sp.]|nr:acyloxyacyl hydrolase [Odoribacter sp.]